MREPENETDEKTLMKRFDVAGRLLDDSLTYNSCRSTSTKVLVSFLHLLFLNRYQDFKSKFCLSTEEVHCSCIAFHFEISCNTSAVQSSLSKSASKKKVFPGEINFFFFFSICFPFLSRWFSYLCAIAFWKRGRGFGKTEAWIRFKLLPYPTSS